MSGPGLGSDGLPYTISPFHVAGQIPIEESDRFYKLEGDWRKYLLQVPKGGNGFPLQFTIVDFP